MMKRNLTFMTRRQLALFIGGGVVVLVALVGLVIVAASRRGDGGPNGGADAGLTPVQAATMPPAATATVIVPGPPTGTPTASPTATQAPSEHVVQEGETLLYIIQLYGYQDLAVVPEILVMNNMISENDLQVGQVLLIPQPTPSPAAAAEVPVGGGDATAAATSSGGANTGGSVDYTGCSLENRCISPDGQFWVHTVQEGDTLAGIAYGYSSFLPALYEANNMNDQTVINIGDLIYVPILVTLTPTLTPTGGPDSTATPTPTTAPPALLAPAPAAEISRSDAVVLQWVPVHPLHGSQHYLVVIRNLETDAEFQAVTRSNAYRLPVALQPGIGQSIRYQWNVVIVNDDDVNAPVVGGQGPSREFTWGS